MAFNFPNTPSDGALFTPIVGGPTYTWVAATGAWKLASNGLNAGVYIGDNPPANPVVGQLWWESDSGNTFIYYTDANSSQWIQFNTGPVTAIPAGAVSHFAVSAAPAGWLKANGAMISRTTYSDLFTAIGVQWGPGDGSTTFQLPDLRGEFLRGWDDGRGVDTSRIFGSSQADALQNITGQFKCAPSSGGIDAQSGAFLMVTSGTYNTTITAGTAAGVGYGNFDASRVARTSTETRGRNVALLACIKY